MAREQDEPGFEWVNEWVGSAPAEPAAALPVPAAQEAAATIAEQPAAVPPRLQPVAPAGLAANAGDQLMRDIAEIERARDRLAALPAKGAKRTRALSLVPSRTSDAVPIVVGGVLALAMLTVFGAAAAMTKLAR
jgi:hypothetical protein